MTVAPQNPNRNTHPRVRRWQQTDAYGQLKTAVSRANALLDEQGNDFRHTFYIDTSDTPFAVCYTTGGDAETLAWWTPDGGLQMTERGQYDDTFGMAAETVGI